MTYTSSNMIDMNGALTKIFSGFLLAIIGCVIIISDPDLSQLAYLLLLVAGILVAVSFIALAQD